MKNPRFCRRDKVLGWPQTSTSPPKGNHMAYSALSKWVPSEAAAAAVEMFRVTVAGLDPGVTLVGENEQLVAVGSPEEHVSEMEFANDPPSGLILRLKVAV